MPRLIVFLWLCVAATSCGPKTLSDEEAANALLQKAQAYASFGKELNARQMPANFKQLSPDERRQYLVDDTRLIGEKFETLAVETESIQGSDTVKPLQSTFVAFFRGQADEWKSWSKAIASRDRTAIDATGRAIDKAMFDGARAIHKEVAKLVGDHPQLRRRLEDMTQHLDNVERSMSTPTTP